MISTIIPTYNRPRLLMERAIPSVMVQDGKWECLVVGDGTDELTVRLMDELTRSDKRFRFWNLPHAEYPEDPQQRWAVQGTTAFNFGLDQARGDFISYLGDDDAYEPHHHKVLYSYPGVDVIHGQALVDQNTYGNPEPGAFCAMQGAYIMRRTLGIRARTTPQKWAWDAHWWLDTIAAGASFQFVNAVVLRYWPDPTTRQYHGRTL